MRRWMLISAGAITALLVALLAFQPGADAPSPAVAGPAAVETPATDRPGRSAAPAPALPTEPTAVPELTGNADVDQMVRDLLTNTDTELDEKLAAIDKEISDRKLVERANDAALSAAEHAELGRLLRRSNAVNIVKTQRLIAKLDALDSEADAVAETRTP